MRARRRTLAGGAEPNIRSFDALSTRVLDKKSLNVNGAGELGLWCSALLLAELMALPVHNTTAGYGLPAKRRSGRRSQVRLCPSTDRGKIAQNGLARVDLIGSCGREYILMRRISSN